MSIDSTTSINALRPGSAVGERAGAAPGTTVSAAQRLAGVAGLAGVVLFVVGFMLVQTPDGNASDATWHSWFASRPNQVRELVSGFLVTGAALALVTFLGTTWHRLALAAGPGRLSPLPLVTATIGAAAVATGAVCNAVVGGALIFQNIPVPSADVLRFSDNIGYPMIAVAGMWAFAACIAGLTVQARGLRYLGTPMTVLGVLAVLGGVSAFMFFPMALPLIWFIAASVVVLRRPIAA